MAIKATLAAMALAFAAGVAPDPVINPTDWAKNNLFVADGPIAGKKWDPELTPYLPGITECLGDEHPCTVVSVSKSAQTGLTQGGVVWIGSIIDINPARAMVVFPTLASIKQFNREKLAPAIEASPALRTKVRADKSRSSQSSTELSKRFPGGSLTLTGANSSADLRSKSIKFVFCDEIDEWPLDLNGQGDPMGMVDARQISFHTSGNYKKFQCSTPTLKHLSRIVPAFMAGDRRYWMVRCPKCGHQQRLVFGATTKHGLKFNKTYPYNAHYVCEHGCPIEHHHKHKMVQEGEWVATKPGPGRQPSFHIDTLVSLFTTWDRIAEEWWAAQDDPAKLKTFVNLWLGEAYEERGEAPDWQILMGRRETYKARTIPFRGLLLTGGADVQKRGIWYEVVAWGRDKQSWSIDHGYIEGDTDHPDNPVWYELAEVVQRRYVNEFGLTFPVDGFAVDAGYNTQSVYNFTRRFDWVYAVDGRDGWHVPPLTTPTPQEVDVNGKKQKNGVMLYGAGTWRLKSLLYAFLRQKGARDGDELLPAGWCHFSDFHDEEYFKQLTAEYLKETLIRGRPGHEWVRTRPDNHLLDCRVYAMALAEHFGLSTMNDEEWSNLERIRAMPPENPQGDLLSTTPQNRTDNSIWLGNNSNKNWLG